MSSKEIMKGGGEVRCPLWFDNNPEFVWRGWGEPRKSQSWCRYDHILHDIFLYQKCI